MEQVGFKVTKTVVQQNELIDNALKGNFEAYVVAAVRGGQPGPELHLLEHHHHQHRRLSINMARNDDPRVQTALQVGRSSTTAKARAKAYQKVNEYFAQDLPYLWADRAVWAVVAHPTVQNFNNPTTPSGAKAYGMIGGSIWPTQIWLS